MTQYGLRAQVIAYTILPTIFIGCILAGYFSFHRYQQANEFLINRALNIAEPLAIASKYGMQDESRTILRRLIGATHRKNSPMIKSIAIFTDDNELFVISNYHREYQMLRLNPNVPIPDLPQVKVLDDTVVIHSPIIDETNFLEYQLTFDEPRKVIGYVAIEVNREQVDLLLYRDGAISILVVLMGILGSLYLAFRQAKLITEPITEMASVVEKISLGRLNSRVSGEYTGEIASLQHGINEMALAMSKHHEEMQDSIDLATSELRETLDQMEVQNIELDITRKKAQQAASVKSEFLANMSHELRTPLNGVIGFARQLLKTKMTNNQVDYLKTIERSAGNLLGIINDILDFSKLEAGKLDLEHIPFDIRDSIDETLNLLAPSAHDKNIELSLLVDSAVPQELIGDAMRLQQILTNLIGNAIKFTEVGNIEVKIQPVNEKTTGHYIDNNITLKFIISDTGIGISEQQQKQLFKAFGQADSSITRQYGGTGLGLVITQKLVRQMQGKIELLSTPNAGSSFWFTVNIEKNPRAPLATLPVERLSGRHLLVYEANDYAARACTQLLSQWKTDATITETELQWSKSLDKRYDSIVIGHSDNNSIRPLLNHIEQAKPYTDNIIVLLNSSDPGLYEQLMETGITHCLNKPINHRNFANALLSNQTSVSTLPAYQPIQRKDINVMAVDDNEANLKLISAMLSDRVNRVTTCKNGQEAVDHAKEMPFDIIFMDIQMPVLDGVSACTQIKRDSLNQGSPIIAVTAHVLPGEKEQFLQKGMDDCLAKPIDEQALQDIINKWAPNAKVIEVVQQDPPQTTPVKTPRTPTKSFDWSLALQQAAGKELLAKEMLSMLLKEFDEVRVIAQAGINEEVDHDQFSALIHKFHGGCSYSGVPKLKNIAGLIEKELKSGTSPHALEPELLELLDELDNVEVEAKIYLV